MRDTRRATTAIQIHVMATLNVFILGQVKVRVAQVNKLSRVRVEIC